MWFTLDGGRRIQVKKEDVELLLCADAQGSVEGRVYAILRIMMNSKTMMDDLSYHTIVLPRLIGYDQCC